MDGHFKSIGENVGYHLCLGEAAAAVCVHGRVTRRGGVIEKKWCINEFQMQRTSMHEECQ